jgi:hypothetical protein
MHGAALKIKNVFLYFREYEKLPKGDLFLLAVGYSRRNIL